MRVRYVNTRPIASDRAQWLQAREEEDWRVRSRVAKDLLNRNVLIGQSRSQLLTLLGEPDKYADASDQQLYYLIREDWDGIDPTRPDHLLIDGSERPRNRRENQSLSKAHAVNLSDPVLPCLRVTEPAA